MWRLRCPKPDHSFFGHSLLSRKQTSLSRKKIFSVLLDPLFNSPKMHSTARHSTARHGTAHQRFGQWLLWSLAVVDAADRGISSTDVTLAARHPRRDDASKHNCHGCASVACLLAQCNGLCPTKHFFPFLHPYRTVRVPKLQEFSQDASAQITAP